MSTPARAPPPCSWSANPWAGRRHVFVRARRTRLDFAAVIKTLGDELYPAAEKIVLVMDQLNTHGVASLYEAYPPAEALRLAKRLEIHHTPKHGSWLNMAEIELSVLARQCLDERMENQEKLARAVAAWQQSRQRCCRPHRLAFYHGGRSHQTQAPLPYCPTLKQHYSFTNLKELTCRWTALKAGAVLQTGTLNIDCGPMQTVQAAFPAPAGMTALRLDFDHGDGTSVIASNLAVEGVPLPAAPSALAPGGALTTQDGPDTLLIRNTLQELAFDKHSGAIRSWRVDGRDRLVGGAALNLGEARGKNKSGDDKGIYRADQPPDLGDGHRPCGGGRSGLGHARDDLRPPARRRDAGALGAELDRR